MSKITFDQARYDQLINDLVVLENSVVHEAAKRGMPIDDEFSPVPGTPAWALADLQTKSKALGASIEKQNKSFEQQLETFIAALRNARTIFEETNDLASYSITEFLSDYPELGSGGSTT